MRLSLPSTQFCHESNRNSKDKKEKKNKNPLCSADRGSVPDWEVGFRNAAEQAGIETSETPGTTTCVCTLQQKMLLKQLASKRSQINFFFFNSVVCLIKKKDPMRVRLDLMPSF